MDPEVTRFRKALFGHSLVFYETVKTECKNWKRQIVCGDGKILLEANCEVCDRIKSRFGELSFTRSIFHYQPIFFNSCEYIQKWSDHVNSIEHQRGCIGIERVLEPSEFPPTGITLDRLCLECRKVYYIFGSNTSKLVKDDID